jgi:hypothetical protein
MPHHVDVGDRPTTVGDHHREISQDPTPVPTRRETPTAPSPATTGVGLVHGLLPAGQLRPLAMTLERGADATAGAWFALSAKVLMFALVNVARTTALPNQLV